MQFYEAIVVILCLTAAFAYINERFIKLPTVIGVTVLSLIGSLALIFAGKLFPQVTDYAIRMAATINFPALLMRVMLGLLLFAGSIQMSERELKAERISITVLSTIGTGISVVIVGTLVYWLLPLLGLPMDYIYCLLFGAIISPTDPIAVLSILRQAAIPKTLEVRISGESLFNDGVAVVIFASLFQIAQQGLSHLSVADIGLLFARQAFGGVAFGLALGYAGFRLIRPIDSYQVELMLTLALVMGGYALAERLEVSGPLAMVVAGIITGNKGRSEAMSPVSRDYLSKFWELADEVLNAVLFLLIGLEMLLMKMDGILLALGGICILIVLTSRWVSVAVPVTLMRPWIAFSKGAIGILTWGGLRGGISVAMALSLTAEMGHDVFVPVTYIIVLFSILVQGLTIGRVARRIS